MDNQNNISETIDNYLMGNLSKNEAGEFEKKIQGDPKLAGEVQMQKGIMDGIKKMRHSQLKSRLDALPTPSLKPAFPKAAVIGGGVFVAASLAVLITWYANNTGKENYNPNVSVNNDTENVMKPEVKPIPPQSKIIDQERIERETAIKQTDQKRLIEEKKSTVSEVENNNISSNSTAKTNIVLPDIDDNLMSESEIKVREEVEKENKNEIIGEGDVSVNNAVEIATNEELEKNEIHYKYFDEKLYLYGTFDESYQLLELREKAGNSLYMYYKGDYYEINENTIEPTKFDALNDPILISKLEKILESK